jgi:uncharacterized phage protein (TIGR02220 family)
MSDDKPVYAQINRKVWNTSQFRALSQDARELFFYLTTCPHGNMLGIFVLRPGYALDDLQWGTDRKRFAKGLAELLEQGLFEYDSKNEIILDREQIEKHPPENPNQVRAAIKLINSLPKTPLFQSLKLLVEQLGKQFLEPLAKQLGERFGKPVTVTVTVTETETETEEKLNRSKADPPKAPQGAAPEIPYFEIIEYLNQKTGKNFDHQSKETRAKIKARWGINGKQRTIEDFVRVIDNKCASWLNDPVMVNYLRPETLFGTKFESYLNEKPHELSGVVSDKTIRTVKMLDDWRPPV